MFVNMQTLPDGVPCTILGYGHSELPDELLFDNEDFIHRFLSSAGQQQLMSKYGLPGDTTDEAFARAAQAFTVLPGIVSRHVYPGPTDELGVLAARSCLRQAGVSASELDYLIVGTNTGTGYPSTAAGIKGMLEGHSDAATFDMQEACPVGAMAVMVGSALIRARYGRKILVVAAERANTLASPDDFEAANLFGDEAGALLLAASTTEQLLFFSAFSDPYNRKTEWIKRQENGRFKQDGHAVHEFVGQAVPDAMASAFAQSGLPPESFQHLILHQASGKTVDFLVKKKLPRRWQEWMANVRIHRNVETHGNTSGACSSWLISRGIAEGSIKRGERVLVATFGSGMSIAIYGFIVP